MIDTETHKPTPKGSVTAVSVAKADDTKALVTNGTEAFPDDEFQGMYIAGVGQGGKEEANAIPVVLQPPFNPGTLRSLTTTNNTLLQCVDVMEVNIDGTGFTIELVENGKDNEKEKAILQEFFDEPYPGKSMIAIRRDIRDDMESTGMGYLEVIRSAADDVVMVNHALSDNIRLVRLDDPITVTKELQRNGQTLKVKTKVRERRFLQYVNGVKVYFKEFGASRDLNKVTGKWAKENERLNINFRASELMAFVVRKDAKSPYGVPRWINQLPSVLGSRKAEEFNLEFFDSGGLPPVMVLVQGGYLGTDVKDNLVAHLGGKGVKHRAVVVEAISASGSLDSSGSVKVTVERFGAERMSDAMFQNYDKAAEEHVRAAFRLPPLFMGKAQDYNFATAQTGYMVAEGQVFAPERQLFDEAMWLIVKALGVKNYTYKSKALVLTDVTSQTTILTLALTNGIVDDESAVKTMNKMGNFDLIYQKRKPPPGFDENGVPLPPPADPNAQTAPSGGNTTPSKGASGAGSNGNQKEDPSKVGNQTATGGPNLRVVKEDSYSEAVFELVNDYANMLGLRGPCTFDAIRKAEVKAAVDNLQGEDRKLFTQALASRSLVGVSNDVQGLSELCGAVAFNFTE